MAARKRKRGPARRKRAPSGPIHRVSAYIRGDKAQTWSGATIGRILKKSCKRHKPGSGSRPGAWISNETCSYVVEIDGRKYVGRGHGDNMHVNLRQSKTLQGR